MHFSRLVNFALGASFCVFGIPSCPPPTHLETVSMFVLVKR